jgi:hypothetical protein
LNLHHGLPAGMKHVLRQPLRIKRLDLRENGLFLMPVWRQMPSRRHRTPTL